MSELLEQALRDERVLRDAWLQEAHLQWEVHSAGKPWDRSHANKLAQAWGNTRRRLKELTWRYSNRPKVVVTNQRQSASNASTLASGQETLSLEDAANAESIVYEAWKADANSHFGKIVDATRRVSLEEEWDGTIYRLIEIAEGRKA